MKKLVMMTHEMKLLLWVGMLSVDWNYLGRAYASPAATIPLITRIWIHKE
jgi:hypothetical protein